MGVQRSAIASRPQTQSTGTLACHSGGPCPPSRISDSVRAERGGEVRQVTDSHAIHGCLRLWTDSLQEFAQLTGKMLS